MLGIENKKFKQQRLDKTNLYPDTSNLVNNSVDKNKHSKVLFNNTSSHQIKNNIIDNQFNKSNKDINKSLINKSDSKLNNNSSVINSTIHFNSSNLVNIVVDKNNKSNVLFNDSSDDQSQYNKSFKIFELDKDSSNNDNSIGLTNDSISKELNNSEINNISNNSSKDNHINHVSEPKQDKDYIMLLIPTILVLLGAIILYKKNK